MRHAVYFLISPRPELFLRLQALAGGDISDLLSPIIWSGSEFDKTSLQHEDLDLMAKIFFLDTLHRERVVEIEFSNAFPDFHVSVNYFDSLWNIQRVKLDMSIEVAIEDAIESGTIHSIGPTNNGRIDELLSFYRSKKT